MACLRVFPRILRAGLVLSLAGCVLAACGESTPSSGARTGIGGRWHVVSGASPHEIELVDRGETALFRAGGDEATIRRTGDGAYEGSKSAPEGTLRFKFRIRPPDGLTVHYTVLAGGVEQEAPPVHYGRVPDPSTGPRTASPGSGTGLRADLVGAWRLTEAMSVGDRSFVTDTHLELGAEGRFSTWSRTEGHTSERTPRIEGTWTTADDTLRFRPTGSEEWTSFGRVRLHEGKLVLTTPDGTRKFFDRR